MKTINVKLDPSSIDNAIKELEDYKEALLKKVKLFVNALAQDGISVANARLASTYGDSTNGSIGFGLDDAGNIVSATISLDGSDALFIEFGSGIVFNAETHPLAGKFGYGPGTYPGQTHVPVPGYWYYGGGKLSVGTGASMPMYKAAETMRNNAIMRASEIFRS